MVSLKARMFERRLFTIQHILGDLWKFHRSMTRPFFNRDRISHFDNFDRHAEDAIRQFKNRLYEGHPVDFQVHLFCLFKMIGRTDYCCRTWFRGLHSTRPQNSSSATMWVRSLVSFLILSM